LLGCAGDFVVGGAFNISLYISNCGTSFNLPRGPHNNLPTSEGNQTSLFQPTKVQKVIENNLTYFRQVRERHIFSNKISNKTPKKKHHISSPDPKKKHSFPSIQKVFHLFVPLLLDLLLLGWFTPYHAKSRLDATALGII